MPTLVKEAKNLFERHAYTRKGGKKNRKTQQKRALFFCDWAQKKYGITSLGQIGKNQIHEFFKQHSHLAVSTQYGYWLALCDLWLFSEKQGKPPKPQQAA